MNISQAFSPLGMDTRLVGILKRVEWRKGIVLPQSEMDYQAG
jgi:hypothetical protein